MFSKEEIKKILIIRNDGLGDFILSLPAMQALRNNYPMAKLVLFTAIWQEEIARAFNFFDEVILWEAKHYFSRPQIIKYQYRRMFKFLPLIRRYQFDLAIDFKGNLANCLFIWLAGIKLRFVFKPKKDTHRAEDFCTLIKEVSMGNAPLDFILPIPNDKKDRVEEFLFREGFSGQERICVMHPVARWQAKRWPKENFAKLSMRLASELGLKIIFVGGTEDLQEINRLQNKMKLKTIVAAGRLGLLETALLIKKANLFVGNDAAPMHIAGLFNIPTLGLFGTANPKVFGPLGERSKIIQRIPIDKISVDEVFTAAKELFNDQ